MNRLKLALKLSCAAALAWPLLNACGGDDRPDALAGTGATGGTNDGGRRPRPDAGDGSSDVSTDGRGGTGGSPDASDAAANLPGAPIVTITSPKALPTPTADVVTGAEVTVLCTVRKASIAGAFDVDDSTVAIELLDAAGTQIQESSATPTSTANQYQARFPLAQVPAGRVMFRCSGRELSPSRLLGTHEMQTFIDHGPRVTINEPAAGSARALKDPVRFDFTVLPERLADTDPAAEVDSVKFSVDAVDRTAKLVETAPGRYSFSIRFTDAEFRPTPSGSIAVTVTAKNRRSTAGTVREHTYFFALDGTGPKVTVLSPRNTAVVGGEIALQFTAVDEHAGNDLSKVVVDISGTRYTYGQTAGLWSENNGTITFLFDSKSVSNAVAQVNIDIEATDRVGNESKTNHILYLDNQAPIVDLDPPLIRERVPEGTGTVCSDPFDPIGDAPPTDLSTVLPARLFRALVWERTNYAQGATEVFYAGVKEDSVQLFLHRDTTTPLVIDTTRDPVRDPSRVCDDIAPDRRGFQTHRLTGLDPTGDSFFGSSTSDPPLLGCPQRKLTIRPEKLCEQRSSDMTRVIDHIMAGRNRVIFAAAPMPGVTCTGLSWEIASWAGEGWACLAARAEDEVGNIGVSSPLRLCIDDRDAANGTPDCDPARAPSCTDGCASPRRFVDEFPARILPRAL